MRIFENIRIFLNCFETYSYIATVNQCSRMFERRSKKLHVYYDFQPYFLNEVLVPAMVAVGQLEKLYQLLLFRVIPDAKQLVSHFFFKKSKPWLSLQIHSSASIKYLINNILTHSCRPHQL